MIADLKPYPEMKDSGLTWFGKVPEHWEVLPNRAIFTEVKRCGIRSTDVSEQLLRVSQVSSITQRKRKDGGDELDTKATHKEFLSVRPEGVLRVSRRLEFFERSLKRLPEVKPRGKEKSRRNVEASV